MFRAIATDESASCSLHMLKKQQVLQIRIVNVTDTKDTDSPLTQTVK